MTGNIHRSELITAPQLAVQSAVMAEVFNHAMAKHDPDIPRSVYGDVDPFEEFFARSYRRPKEDYSITDPPPSSDAAPVENQTTEVAGENIAGDSPPSSVPPSSVPPSSVMGNVPAYRPPPPPPPAPRIGRFFLQPDGPPPGWRYPATERRPPEADPLLEEFGHYVRRARYLELISQEMLSEETDVPQSQISRVERGFAPGFRLQTLVTLGQGLGRSLPLGFCPHQHNCAWQPVNPTEVHRLGR